MCQHSDDQVKIAELTKRHCSSTRIHFELHSGLRAMQQYLVYKYNGHNNTHHKVNKTPLSCARIFIGSRRDRPALNAAHNQMFMNSLFGCIIDFGHRHPAPGKLCDHLERFMCVCYASCCAFAGARPNLFLLLGAFYASIGKFNS